MKWIINEGVNPSETKRKRKRTRPRMGKHERLLRALLKCVSISLSGNVESYERYTSKTDAKQLVAIKQAMEKKCGK